MSAELLDSLTVRLIWIISSTFNYELILMKMFMNVNIIKTQFSLKIENGLKGHLKSHKVTSLFKNSLFLT